MSASQHRSSLYASTPGSALDASQVIDPVTTPQPGKDD
jgi:hypothetical protein